MARVSLPKVLSIWWLFRSSMFPSFERNSASTRYHQAKYALSCCWLPIVTIPGSTFSAHYLWFGDHSAYMHVKSHNHKCKVKQLVRISAFRLCAHFSVFVCFFPLYLLFQI
jgi:hypothetical protein